MQILAELRGKQILIRSRIPETNYIDFVALINPGSGYSGHSYDEWWALASAQVPVDSAWLQID